MKHTTILLAVLVSISILPFVSAAEVEGGWCVYEDQGACEEGILETPCINGGGDYYDTKPSPMCDIGTCVVGTGTSSTCEETTEIGCDQVTGATFTAGDTCTTTPPDACGEGGEDCLCGGVDISGTEQICCNNNPYTGNTCPDNAEKKNLCSDPAKTPGGSCEDGGVYSNACVCVTQDDIYSDIDPDVCTAASCGDYSCILSTGSSNLKFDSATATPVTGEQEALLEWTIINCDGATVSSMKVDKIDTETGNIFSESLPNEVSGSDTIYLLADKEYDLNLSATVTHKGVSREISKLIQGFSVGQSECMGATRNWCTPEDVAINCRADNTAPTDNKCRENDKICVIGLDDAGNSQAMCQDPVACESCNLAYNVFGELGLGGFEVVVTSTNMFGEKESTTEPFSCQELKGKIDINPTQSVGFCYEDYNQAAQQQMYSCKEISACENYESQEACTANNCAVATECVWENNFCSSTTEDPDCSLLSGDACVDAPGCYWKDPTCFDQPICEALTTESSCEEDGSEWVMNPNTHEADSIAQNDLDLPKCQWFEDYGCAKNSNDDNERDKTSPDHINPSTELLESFDTALLVGQKIDYVVEDNDPFSVGDAITYARFTEPTEDGTCAVSESFNSPVIDQDFINTDALEAGTYCLEYYSTDGNLNREVIQTQKVEFIAADLNLTAHYNFTQYDFEQEFATAMLNWTTNLVSRCEVTSDTYDKIFAEEEMIGTEFIYIMPDINTSHQMTISCENTQYDLQNDTTLDVYVSFSEAIREPFPNTVNPRLPGTYDVGVHAIGDAYDVCEYRLPEDTDWSEMTDTGLTKTYEGLEHTYNRTQAEIDLSDESGVVEVETRCIYPSPEDVLNQTEQNITGPNITFIIDDLAPILNVTYQEESVTNNQQINATAPQLHFSCNDQSMLLGDGVNAKDKSAGQERLVISGTDYYAVLTGETVSVPRTLLSTVAGNEYTITCEDGLGNAAEEINFTVKYPDLIGPGRPDFNIVGGSS